MGRQRVALVTGASSGIGAETAIQLAKAGFVTYAAARRVEKMQYQKIHGVRILKLDVTDEMSIDECLRTIRAESGEIDILVNNAGFGSYGSVEEVPLDEGRRQFEVNLFGLAAMTQKVIPYMREQRWGRVINVSSIGGLFATPFGGWYHASKFAVDGLSHALRQELEPFGVYVSVIRPGAIKTEWDGGATESLLRVSGGGPYRRAANAMGAKLKTMYDGKGMSAGPEVVAQVIVTAATARKPKTVYLAPLSAKMVPLLRKMLSDRMLDWVVGRMMGIPERM